MQKFYATQKQLFSLIFMLLIISLAIMPAKAQLTGVTGTTIICPGTTTTLTATGTGPFNWYSDNEASLLAVGNSFTTPVLNTNTTYWVEGTYGGFVVVNVNVASFPPYQAIATPSTLCAGSSSTLSVPLSTQTVYWSDKPAGGTNLGTGTPTVTPTATTVYYASFQGVVQQQTVTFNYTGNVQTFRVPAGVSSINVDVRGARGGAAHEGSVYEGSGAPGPGLGGRVQCTLNVPSGALLYIYVGGRGYGSGDCEPCSAHPAAYNGGGFVDNSNVNLFFGGGGGASDIRLGSQQLGSRAVVAGGGGGEGAQNGVSPTQNGGGGNGGGLVGAAGGLSGVANNGFPPYPIGYGGSQTAGGTNGTGLPTAGGFGTGGPGYFGGAGGGDYYGGAGGGSVCGGGGGSSYAPIQYCQNVVLTQGYQNGDGQVIITYNPASACTAPATYVLADTVKVNPIVTPAVSITDSVTCSTCVPQTVAFKAAITNGGAAPVYTWYKNNVKTGANSPVYTDAGLTSSDAVWCTVTTNAVCQTINTATSNIITTAPPAITSVSPSSGPAGTLVTIQGANLSLPTALSIGGAPAILVSGNGTQLTAMIMPGASVGVASATTIFGTATGGNFAISPATPPYLQQGSKLTVNSGTASTGLGRTLAISADGNTALSNTTIGGTGELVIFNRSNNVWTQQAILTAAGATGNFVPGTAVALSADGNTALVGGQSDNNGMGAVWVFTRSNGGWKQQGNKLTGSDAVSGSGGSYFGSAVALSADGNTALIGGTNDNSYTGAAWIFNRSSTGVWTQNGSKLTGTGASGSAMLGNAVALSADGNTALVDGHNDGFRLGAVWVFTNNNGTWTQQGSKLAGSGATGTTGAEQGISLAISADGNTAVWGGFHDNGGIGAAWVFTRNGTTWTQQGAKLVGTGIVKPAGVTFINFGQSVSLSADGNMAVVGAPNDNSYTGAMWVFTRTGGAWNQYGNKLTANDEVVKSSFIGFGQTVALSADGSTAMAGDPADNSNAGAAWAFIPVTPVPLNGLTLSTGTLKPVFDPATTSYTAFAANLTTSITITPTVSDPTATITVNGTAVASGSPSGAIALNIGPNTVTIVTTASDGLTTKTYTVVITRQLSANDNMSNLKISTGTFSPAFNVAKTAYTVSEPNTVTGVTFTPFTAQAGATVTVNGVAVASGTLSGQVLLNVGTNIIPIAVTAQNGIAKQTYTVTITRAPATNDNLSLLKISPGVISPVFVTATTGYTSSVTNGVSVITVTPTTTVTTATVTVNGTPVTSGNASAPIALSVGANNIAVVVTAQDGTTKKTYTITVTRAPSSIATLAQIKLKAGVLSPAFAPATTSYSASVVNGVSTDAITPTTSDATATVTINGTLVASGNQSPVTPLSVGNNSFNIIVTAQDGVTTKNYTLTVNRASPAGTNVPDVALSVDNPVENTQLSNQEVIIHAGISPNGDGINDYLVIDGIKAYPDNKLTVMNRNGTLVFETKGYDNASKVFDGRSNKTGQMQLPGTYFYQLEYTVKGVVKQKTGFIVLKY